MQYRSDTQYLYHERQRIKEFLPRVLLVIGGALAMISTALPWLSSIPLIGGINLWQLSAIGSRAGEITQSAGAQLIAIGYLLWAVAVVVLGAGAIVWGVLARTVRGVRTATGVVGGSLLAVGLGSLLFVLIGLDDPAGVGAGEIVLLLGGTVAFAGVFVPAPRYYTVPVAVGWHAALTHSGNAEAAARSVAFVGIGCLIAAGTLFAVGGMRTPSEIHASEDAFEWSQPDPAPGTPDATWPEGNRTPDLAPPDNDARGVPDFPPAAEPSVQPRPPESSTPAPPPMPSPPDPPASGSPDETADPLPQEVVSDYYAAINRGDYRTAWQLGGRNLDSTYEHYANGFDTTAYVLWITEDVSGQQVTGSLDAGQSDGSLKEFHGSYTVRDGEIVSADIRLVS